jgi:hypothetical protein
MQFFKLLQNIFYKWSNYSILFSRNKKITQLFRGLDTTKVIKKISEHKLFQMNESDKGVNLFRHMKICEQYAEHPTYQRMHVQLSTIMGHEVTTQKTYKRTVNYNYFDDLDAKYNFNSNESQQESQQEKAQPRNSSKSSNLPSKVQKKQKTLYNEQLPLRQAVAALNLQSYRLHKKQK